MRKEQGVWRRAECGAANRGGEEARNKSEAAGGHWGAPSERGPRTATLNTARASHVRGQQLYLCVLSRGVLARCILDTLIGRSLRGGVQPLRVLLIVARRHASSDEWQPAGRLQRSLLRRRPVRRACHEVACMHYRLPQEAKKHTLPATAQHYANVFRLLSHDLTD